MNATAVANTGAVTPTLLRLRAEHTAAQFEEVFARYLVQGLRKSLPDQDQGGMFGQDAGAGTYEDWFDSGLARDLTRGKGLGIASVLLRDWERHGQIPKANQAHVAAAGGGLDVHA